MKKYQIQCQLDGDFYLFTVKQYSDFLTLTDDELEKLIKNFKKISDEFETFKNSDRDGDFLSLTKCKGYKIISKYMNFEKDVYQNVIIGFTSFKIIIIDNNEINILIDYDGCDNDE